MQLFKERPVRFVKDHSQAGHARAQPMLGQIGGETHADMIGELPGIVGLGSAAIKHKIHYRTLPPDRKSPGDSAQASRQRPIMAVMFNWAHPSAKESNP